MIIAVALGLSYGLSRWLTLGAVLGLNFGLLTGLYQALMFGWSYGLICTLIGFILRGQTANIRFTERLRWTWNSFSKSLFRINRLPILLLLTTSAFLVNGLSNWIIDWITYATGVGAIFAGLGAHFAGLGATFGAQTGLDPAELQSILYSASISALSIGLLYWLLSSVWQGITQERIEDQDRRVPNEGTRRSLRNSVIISLISAGIIGAIVFLLGQALSIMLNIAQFSATPLIFTPNSVMNDTLLQNPSQQSLSYALPIATLGGLLVFMAMGGLAVWRHSVIRLLLWRSQAFPGRAPQFLNDACARFLLRRVGGGYSFIHRLLLDYFVATREKDL